MHHINDPNKVRTAILTLSDTRTKSDDKSGQLIKTLLEINHEITAYRIITDDAQLLSSVIQDWVEKSSIDAIICNGGTGMSKRDITYNTVANMLEKEMHGFGEQFRQQSFTEVGTRGLLGNAIAGSIGDTAIFALPGSANAVSLAMNKLILPLLPHFIGELRK